MGFGELKAEKCLLGLVWYVDSGILPSWQKEDILKSYSALPFDSQTIKTTDSKKIQFPWEFHAGRR